MAVKVRKKGFSQRAKYPAPAWAIEAAEGYVERTLDAYPETIREVQAELRPVVYCGPGSAGDRGAYMLTCSVWFEGTGHDYFMRDLYPPS